jgi:hypothetical protein
LGSFIVLQERLAALSRRDISPAERAAQVFYVDEVAA